MCLLVICQVLHLTWVIIEYILIQWCWVQATGKSNYIDAWKKKHNRQKLTKWSREKGRPNHKIEEECLFRIILVLIIALSWNRTRKVYCLLFNPVIGMFVSVDKKMALSPGYACKNLYFCIRSYLGRSSHQRCSVRKGVLKAGLYDEIFLSQVVKFFFPQFPFNI